ncbi:hypothetical protein JM18_002832 [Phytophthora kernoviae]|uniref:Microsomal glutathione S-transferase 1 n=1 Tax=Phytophthora kernoviae TaxID=325452 RepID=A0A922AQY9_9STRA|nr:hypothetical protein JM18_002832 [Phytophthora kernoviae]
MVDNNVKVYIACTSVLYFKFLLATGVQGGKKFRSGGRPPEDGKLNLAKTMGKGRTQNYGLSQTDDEKVLKAREVEHRWTRIVTNDLESIPFALFIFGGGILAGSNSTVHAGAMITYTIARCLHTYVYAHAMQPHRALAWAIGTVATLVGLGNAIVAILSMLYLKFLFATGVQGGKKFESGGRPPEDIGLGMAKGRKQTYGLLSTKDTKTLKAREDEQRWTRIVGNDLESIPFALFVFGAGILAGSNPVVHAGAMTAYTASRCLHTYMYANALQPHRVICYLVGVTSTLVGVGNAVAAIL